MPLAKFYCITIMPQLLLVQYVTRHCGRSSGVERNLAKVEVVSSNLIARSIFVFYLEKIQENQINSKK